MAEKNISYRQIEKYAIDRRVDLESKARVSTKKPFTYKSVDFCFGVKRWSVRRVGL